MCDKLSATFLTKQQIENSMNVWKYNRTLRNKLLILMTLSFKNGSKTGRKKKEVTKKRKEKKWKRKWKVEKGKQKGANAKQKK